MRWWRGRDIFGPVDNITRIDDAKLDRIREDLRRMKLYRDVMADYHRELAYIRRQAYLAHVEAGFTEDQALKLVRDIEGQ